MDDTQQDPWQCTASVCSGSALLGDLLGVSRSRERDLLSLLSIYPRILFSIYFVVSSHYVYLTIVLCVFIVLV